MLFSEFWEKKKLGSFYNEEKEDKARLSGEH
jgi:hypothetical protein